MYEVNPQKCSTRLYSYKTKNKYNQKLELEINVWCNSIESAHWNVCFRVGKNKHKERDFEQMCITGKDGIKSLLWAKKCLKDFIKIISKSSKQKINYLEIYWTDSRRRDVYERGLKDLGFIRKNSFLVLKIQSNL